MVTEENPSSLAWNTNPSRICFEARLPATYFGQITLSSPATQDNSTGPHRVMRIKWTNGVSGA